MCEHFREIAGMHIRLYYRQEVVEGRPRNIMHADDGLFSSPGLEAKPTESPRWYLWRLAMGSELLAAAAGLQHSDHHLALCWVPGA